MNKVAGLMLLLSCVCGAPLTAGAQTVVTIYPKEPELPANTILETCGAEVKAVLDPVIFPEPVHRPFWGRTYELMRASCKPSDKKCREREAQEDREAVEADQRLANATALKLALVSKANSELSFNAACLDSYAKFNSDVGHRGYPSWLSNHRIDLLRPYTR